MGQNEFIKETNNIFGHWTYEKRVRNCSQKKDFGASHFIKVFESLEGFYKTYMLNLNRNEAYKSFQEERYNHKEQKSTNFRLSFIKD